MGHHGDNPGDNLRMLVIDTCGEGAGLALGEGNGALSGRPLPSRSSSAEIVPAVRELLAGPGWALGDLDAIGVVAGPGSFTGVRTGLAAAKGLCEATGLRLATVSRLEVLARAAGLREGFAVLGAGRRDLYVRRQAGADANQIDATESMSTIDALLGEARGYELVLAEEALLAPLHDFQPRLRRLSPADAILPLLEALRAGGADLAHADANYVRREAELYARQGSAPCAS